VAKENMYYITVALEFNITIPFNANWTVWFIDWLVFNINFSSISAISRHVDNLVLGCCWYLTSCQHWTIMKYQKKGFITQFYLKSDG